MKTRAIVHDDHIDIEALVKDADGVDVWAVIKCYDKLTAAEVFHLYRKIWGGRGLAHQVKLKRRPNVARKIGSEEK